MQSTVGSLIDLGAVADCPTDSGPDRCRTREGRRIASAVPQGEDSPFAALYRRPSGGVISTIIQVGSYIGGGPLPTVGIVVVTGILGGLLARNQGLAVLRRVQREVQEGRLPTGTLFDGLLILIAGVVLVTPPGSG